MLICRTFVTFVSNSTLTITSTALYLVQQISHSHRLKHITVPTIDMGESQKNSRVNQQSPIHRTFQQICQIWYIESRGFVSDSWPFSFFLPSPTAKTGGRIFTIYTSNDTASPKDEPFEGFDEKKLFRVSKPHKTPKKKAWLGNFNPNVRKIEFSISSKH